MNESSKSMALLVHGVAVICLSVVMVMQAVTDLTMKVKLPNIRVLDAVLTVLVWSFLISRVWKKPSEWGLGLGIFLFLVLAFQIWLWHLALIGPDREGIGVFRSVPIFVLSEVPLFLAAVCCLMLPRILPAGGIAARGHGA